MLLFSQYDNSLCGNELPETITAVKAYQLIEQKGELFSIRIIGRFNLGNITNRNIVSGCVKRIKFKDVEFIDELYGSGDEIFEEIHFVNCTYGDINLKNMKIMIPVDNADEIGVRRIIKSQVINEVLESLKSRKTTEMPSNWNRRYKYNLDKIKTGDVHEVAEVLRNLYLKDQKKGLSMGEKKMLDNAMQILVGEIVCAKRVSVDSAKNCIMEALH